MMTLKKANALLTLLSIFFLTAHLGTCIYSYLAFVYMPVLIHIFAGIAALCIMAHAVISVFILFTQADGFRPDKYPRLNKKTNIQRISGILILLLLFMHFRSFHVLEDLRAAGETSSVRLVIFVQAVFFAVVILHVAVSFSKALISLGIITTEQSKKRVDNVVYIISAMALIIAEYAIITTWSYLFLG